MNKFYIILYIICVKTFEFMNEQIFARFSLLNHFSIKFMISKKMIHVSMDC
jgi:hypothetical protein